MVYRPKWEIALEQLDRAKSNGVVLDWTTFDEGYGKSPEFIYYPGNKDSPATNGEFQGKGGLAR